MDVLRDRVIDHDPEPGGADRAVVTLEAASEMLHHKSPADTPSAALESSRGRV